MGTMLNNTPPLQAEIQPSGLQRYLLDERVIGFKQDRTIFGIYGVAPTVLARRAGKIVFDLRLGEDDC